MEEEKNIKTLNKLNFSESESGKKHANSGECRIKPLAMNSNIQKIPKIRTSDKLRLSEHQLFIECLKTYGKDWQKLEKSIPTRTSAQIMKHAEIFLESIRKEYKTDDPVTYFLNNSTLKIKLEEILETEKNPSKSLFRTGTTDLKATNQTNFRNMKSYKSRLSKPKIRSQEESFRRRLKRSSNEVSFNRSSEEMINPPKKVFIDRHGHPHEVSTNAVSTHIKLNKGEIMLKGNEIHTLVPCEVETILEKDGNEKIVINSKDPIKVIISQLHVNKPMVYDLGKKMFFPLSDYSQLDLRQYSDCSQSENTNLQQMMDMLEKNYCLRDIRAFCGQSSERRLSSLNSSGQNRNGEPNGSFQSSSQNRIDQNSNEQGSGNNSHPVIHNENNQDFFENYEMKKGKN